MRIRSSGSTIRRIGAGLTVGAMLVIAACSRPEPPAQLPALTLDRARTTVSGISSGAYMATQVHLAFSDHVAGAALLAGGPYGCAQGSLETALGQCLNPAADQLPDPAALVAAARERAASGAIAPLEGLAGDAVWVFHGKRDATVAAGVSAAAAAFYRSLGGARVEEDSGRDIAHTFPTVDRGGECATSEAPYIGNCGFDAAHAILSALHGEAPAAAGPADGELRRFDQRAWLDAGQDAQLADSGFLYVPKACSAGETCGLHVAFHGCQQNVDAVGEAFVRDAGYNRWADTYRMVVLYPQTRATFAPLNPKACWDWWGYGGPGYDTRAGGQLRWLARVAKALGAPLE